MPYRLAPDAKTLLPAAALALASCNPAAVADPFDDSGELIALSGGDGGARSACHTCHGLDGAGDGALVPRIAAMNAGYLVRQLGFYADGQRRHPQMSWLAGRLDSEERAAVALYYAEMPLPGPAPRNMRTGDAPAGDEQCALGNAATIYHDGLPGRGLQSCASCHGADGTGVGAGNPSLVGQSSAYHADQLQRWRDGKRYGDALGVMQDAANKLQEDEITPLADYIAHGPAPFRRPAPRAGCP